jgi:hypothetical protein
MGCVWCTYVRVRGVHGVCMVYVCACEGCAWGV